MNPLRTEQPPSAPVRGADVLANAAMAAFFVLLTWSTWGRWGHVRIDAGGAILRASRIADGAILYKDVLAPYPPLGPYAVGGLFAVAGTSLNTVYALGLAILLTESFLLWTIARRFLALPEAAAGLAGFWGLLAFQPFLFNWIVPNVFAATFGVLFATATLALLAQDMTKPRRLHVAIASVSAALAGLSKIEHGLAAVATLTTYSLLLQAGNQPWPKRLAWAWIPGLAVTALTILLVAATVPLETALFDNLYRERSFTNNLDIYRAKLLPPFTSVLKAAVATYFGLAARTIAAGAGLALIGTGRLRTAAGLALAAAAVALPWAYPVPLSKDQLVNIDLQYQFAWTPLAWLLVVGWSIRSLGRQGDSRQRMIFLVGLFSLVSSLRWEFHVVWPAYYAVFAPFLAVLIVTTLVRPFAGQRRPWAVGLVMSAFVLQGTYAQYMTWGSFGYRTSNFVLEYPRGSIKTIRKEGKPMRQVIDYLREHTSPGDPVAVLPEEQLINFLAETRHPTRDIGVGPNWLATTADEDRFIEELEAAGTRFVVLSGRRYKEFGAGGIADYNPRIVDHIHRRYERVLDVEIYEVYRRRVESQSARPVRGSIRDR